MAAEAAARMIHGDPGYSISLLGQTSSGKTMIAKMLRRFWNQHVPPKRYGPNESAKAHHASLISWPSHEWEELADEKDSPCVVVDELGRGQRDSWGRFLDFLNFRQERKLWTIITCNLTWDSINQIDPAIASRMRRSGGVVLQAGAGVRPFEDRKP